MILLGDPAQLPPAHKHIYGSVFFQKFEFYMLKEIVRQKDKEFQNILQRFRVGKQTEADIELFRNKTIDLAQIDPTGTFVFVQNQQTRNSINEYFLD